MSWAVSALGGSVVRVRLAAGETGLALLGCFRCVLFAGAIASVLFVVADQWWLRLADGLFDRDRVELLCGFGGGGGCGVEGVLHVLDTPGGQVECVADVFVPWNLLMVQFGSQYKLERQFKAELLKAMAKVKLVYPAAKVTPTDDGLLLSPSPTPISPRRR